VLMNKGTLDSGRGTFNLHLSTYIGDVTKVSWLASLEQFIRSEGIRMANLIYSSSGKAFVSLVTNKAHRMAFLNSREPSHTSLLQSTFGILSDGTDGGHNYAVWTDHGIFHRQVVWGQYPSQWSSCHRS